MLTFICWQYTQIVVRSLSGQIYDALKRSDLTVAELLARSGLSIKRCTLQRKLSGDEAMRTSEAEALASALGLTLVWMPTNDTAAGDDSEVEAEGAA